MRTKNTLKTFLYGILMTSIIAVLGLVKTKCLLMYLGEEYVSVYQLFYQLFTYLSLVDGGIGASVTYHLYKPVHEKDTDSINSVFAGAKHYFIIIGIIVVLLGISLSFGIMFLIKETTIASWYIRVCFILFIISSATSYFTTAHALLYESEQKLYKASNLNHLLSICESIVAIVVSYLGGKLMLILTIFLVLSIIKNIILIKMSKREHKYLVKNAPKDLSFKKEANNLIVSKINTLINENIDVVILSKFVGLNSVFIYTAYNQIVNMIKLMVQRLNSALLPSVGNLFVAEKAKAKATFRELNSLLFFIGSILFAPLLYLLTPFVRLWYGGEYTVSLLVSFLFVAVLFINIVKISLETYIKAAGEFASVKYSSIYQCIVNTALSLILVQKFGIAGVLCATVFAFITGNFIHYPRIIAKKITDDNPWYYYLKCMKYLLFMAVNIVICYFVFNLFTINNLLMWLLVGVIIFIINAVLTLVLYIVFKENLFFSRVKRLINK